MDTPGDKTLHQTDTEPKKGEGEFKCIVCIVYTTPAQLGNAIMDTPGDIKIHKTDTEPKKGEGGFKCIDLPNASMDTPGDQKIYKTDTEPKKKERVSFNALYILDLPNASMDTPRDQKIHQTDTEPNPKEKRTPEKRGKLIISYRLKKCHLLSSLSSSSIRRKLL